jgi:nucleoside-diphosphate kinase
MTETSLTFIKPPFLDKSDEIWPFLEERLMAGFEKRGPGHVYVPRSVFEEHYSHVRKYGFFDSMVEELVKEGINLCAYQGQGIISDIRRVLGPTDPSQAGADTIRGRFSDDVLKVALSENRVVRNVMHASGSIEEGAKEFVLFAPYLPDW